MLLTLHVNPPCPRHYLLLGELGRVVVDVLQVDDGHGGGGEPVPGHVSCLHRQVVHPHGLQGRRGPVLSPFSLSRSPEVPQRPPIASPCLGLLRAGAVVLPSPSPQSQCHPGAPLVTPMPTTSRSRPGRAVQISPVVALMLNMPPAPCSRMEYRTTALSVSGSSASVASTVITQVPAATGAPWWVPALRLVHPPFPQQPLAGLTWLSTLHHVPCEHILPEERPVVVLVHHDDLQVGGVLQCHTTQVQRKGFQLWA